MNESELEEVSSEIVDENMSASQLFSQQLTSVLGGDLNYTNGDSDLKKDEFLERFYRRMAADGVRHQGNLGRIAHGAQDLLTEISEGSVFDADWLIRFIHYSKEISNLELQKKWSEVLAREFEEPGSFDLLTLSILSNMNKKDLAICETASELVFSEEYLFKVGEENDLNVFNLDKVAISQLQALGILNDSLDLTAVFSAEEGGLTFDYYGAKLILRHDSLAVFSLPVFKFTNSGIQILRLFDGNLVNQNYLKAFGQGLDPLGYEYRLRLPDGSLTT